MDTDLEAGEVVIRSSLQRLTGEGLVPTPVKTTSSRRTLALAPSICEGLVRHRERQDFEREFAEESWIETGYVFTSLSGTPMDPRNLTRRFEELRHESGLRMVRFPDLQHKSRERSGMRSGHLDQLLVRLEGFEPPTLCSEV
jgi:hypothetical protein